MITDIRQRPRIDHEDVLRLNFIRTPTPFVFRRHYRQGLRSHVMAVLTPRAVHLERVGICQNGQRRYPTARPIKVLRLFRHPFSTWQEAFEDIKRFQVITSYLTTEYLAVSEEFIADYRVCGKSRVILCGLQEFVDGDILDPWALGEGTLGKEFSLTCRIKPPDVSWDDWLQKVRYHARRFVGRIRRMILSAGLIPDLAGNGNLLLTSAGAIILVDINNICRVSFDTPPVLDEKGYPTCDKSIEALSRIESCLLDPPAFSADPIYRHFLTPCRMSVVTEMHRAFHSQLSTLKA